MCLDVSYNGKYIASASKVIQMEREREFLSAVPTFIFKTGITKFEKDLKMEEQRYKAFKKCKN